MRGFLPRLTLQLLLSRRIEFCSLLVILLCLPAWVPAQTSVPTEHQMKAAFLYNFAKFFEWPNDAMGTAGQPFSICVLGATAVGSQLRQLVKDKSIDTHPIVIRELHASEAVRGCHIVFVGGSITTEALENFHQFSVLTVGEAPGFCQRGGIVNFWMETDHIRFEVNPRAADQAHLHPSSKLLRLARIVGDQGSAGEGH